MIQNLILKEREHFNTASNNYEKLNHINNVINLKLMLTDGNDPTIYGDIKEFLELYVKSTEEKAYGYYELDQKKIFKLVSLVSIEQRINLLNYLNRILKLNAVENNYKWVNKELRRIKLLFFWENRSIKNIIKLIYYLATFNILTLLLTIFILYLFYSILLLPAPYNDFVVFKSVFVNYSNNKILNNFLNTSMSFCNIESTFKINPINFRGVVLELFIKLSLFVLVLGFLTEELKKRLL